MIRQRPIGSLSVVFWGKATAVSALLVLATVQAAAQAPQVVKNPYADVNWDAVTAYTANFHSHTVYSDGRAEPDQLIHLYAGAGYHILAITDHDNGYNHREGERDIKQLYTFRDEHDRAPTAETTWPWTRWIDETPSRIWVYGGIESSAFYPELGDVGMLAIRGAELSAHPHTVSLFNWSGWPHRNTTDDERVARVEEHDGLMFWAHPTHYVPGGPWEDRFFEDPTWDKAVEYFGRYITQSASMLGFEVRDVGDRLPRDRELFNRLLARYYPDHDIFVFGSDDTHGTSIPDNASLTLVLAEELTEEAVRTALTRGHTFIGTRTDPLPQFKRIAVDEAATTITVDADNYERITWIKDGAVHATGPSLDFSAMKEAVVRFEVEQGGATFFSQAFYIR
jgi:hypothetical protein